MSKLNKEKKLVLPFFTSPLLTIHRDDDLELKIQLNKLNKREKEIPLDAAQFSSLC